jgi:hypothetical protein
MTNEIAELKKKVAAAIFDPGNTEGYKGERSLTEWQADAVMRVLSVLSPSFVVKEDVAMSAVDAGMFSDIHEARREIAMAEFMDNRPTLATPDDGWRTMESAPKDGTPFVAIRRWPTRIECQVYRWVGHPNYWHCKDAGICIRPEYQEQHLWCPLPALPTPPANGRGE